MKSTTEVLNEIATDEGFHDWAHFLIYEEGATANITSKIKQAMITYAEQVRDEDRKIVAGNIKFQYGEMDVEGVTHREIVDIDYTSILNAPKPELK